MHKLNWVVVNLCDYWLVIDNSNRPYAFIAEGNEDVISTIYSQETWFKIKNTKNEKEQSK